MFINAEKINKIAIHTVEKPVDFNSFANFIQKSPYIRQIAFIGPAILEMPEFEEMIELCAINNIHLIFGEIVETKPENIIALVKYKNVIALNIHENDKNLELLVKTKQEMFVRNPEISVIVKKENSTPDTTISKTSYGFYNLADDVTNIACLNLLREPMINYNGELLGCWQNPDKKHPINAFDLGMKRALNKSEYKKMLNMVKTGKIDTSCPCARCPIFMSLIWTNKKIDVKKRLFSDK